MKTVVLMEEYMRKKKHKKKNKNMKKREIQKMQVENQQEVLGADVDKNQVENQQEILVDAAEKEQRRTTRLGAIIAIVAVIGTLCAFLFKMTISSLNVWSEQGVMYWYLQALFSFALSTSVIIFIDIVLYVISDLKRYNTLDQNYKQYDQESDNRYMYLLSDFRIYTIMRICITKISTFLILCDLAVCLATLYVSFSLVFALMRYLQGKVFLIRFYSPTTLSSSRAEFRLPSRLACA